MKFDTYPSTDEETEESGSNFSYLLSLPLYSLTKEKIIELQNKANAKEREVKELTNTTIEELWINDLDKFEDIYRKTLDKDYEH